MAASGEIENALRTTSNKHEAYHILSDHEDLDTRIALHA